MTTRRHRASISGPSVPVLLAWTGYDRTASGEPDAAPAFSATALTAPGVPRPGAARHARHSATAGAADRRPPLIGAARARHVTAGVVLVCGSVLAAAVTTTDGTLGPQDDMAIPEVAPGQPPQAALPAGAAPVETAAVSRPVSSATVAETGPAAATPSPEAAAGSGVRQPASPVEGAAAGNAATSAAPSGADDGAAPSRPSGTTSEEPERSGTSGPPADGAADEEQPSPVEQVTEPVRRVAEPVTQRVTEPIEDAGQSAVSMLDQPLL